MAKEKLRGKHLKKLGYTEGKVIGIALNMMDKHFKREGVEKKIDILRCIISDPVKYKDHDMYKEIALELLPKTKEALIVDLNNEKIDYPVFGASYIENGAIQQMETAMRLPVTLAGALMPDAHQGYGLPIGGVLATQNSVIPYAVGMDIGCRMSLSIYNLPENYIKRYKSNLKKILIENTRFGNHAKFENKIDDELLERKEFDENKLLKQLHHYVVEQIGTSGSGNHFVEFGDVEVLPNENLLQLPVGKYIGVLAHSGSRHFGYEIAQFYTHLAMEKCKLPNEAKHLAWFDLDSDEGKEYWVAMNLAGDFAQSNHHHIHKRIAKALHEKPVAILENHHNFAWKEKIPDGRSAIVHRKGATPAQTGIIGLIPGSMASHGYIISGKGNPDSLNSCSHGAGRAMSRNKAMASFTRKFVSQFLEKNGVDLIGGGIDEAPQSYKDINKVMEFQKALVDIAGTFFPRIVRMDG